MRSKHGKCSGSVAAICLLVVMAAYHAPAAAADLQCGQLRSDVGPWDYNDPADGQMLKLVEKAHFNAAVENLTGTLSSTDVMSDIDYTLRRFPNHYRALYTMSRYYLENTARYNRTDWQPPECYFQLAIEWRPQDEMVWTVYAIFLHKTKRLTEATNAYLKAVEINPNSAEAHYNLGLLYASTGDIERAREQARDAYRLGYPLPGLKDMLRRKGAWTAEDAAAIRADVSAGSNPVE